MNGLIIVGLIGIIFCWSFGFYGGLVDSKNLYNKPFDEWEKWLIPTYGLGIQIGRLFRNAR